MNINNSSNTKYFSQLDFLRFVAVGLVIWEHWFATSISRTFEIGYLGVLLFFVLSGFLISGILLRNRSSIANRSVGIGKILKVFYIRRTLRIFPVYYVLIFFLIMFSFEGIRDKLTWYIFYGSNIYTYMQQTWDGMIGPFWSLAVEEQFYLIWPLLLLLMPSKRLPMFFMACFFMAPLFRLLSIYWAHHFSSAPLENLSMRVLMPSCIDSFAAGGILAFWYQNRDCYSKVLSKLSAWYSVIGLSALSLLLLLLKESYVYYIFFPTIFSWVSAVFVLLLLTPNSGPLGFILNNPFLLFIGKISYGIYLFHGPFPLIFSVVDYAFIKVGANISIYDSLNSYSEGLKKIIWVAYLIGLSTLSYFLIEMPFNKLKDKFLYK